MLRTVKVICGINTVKREQPLLIEMEDLLRPEGIAFSVEELSSKAQAEYAVYRESDCGVFFVPERCFYQNAYQAREQPPHTQKPNKTEITTKNTII